MKNGNLEQKLGDWNGKSADAITAIYQSHHKEPEFLESVVEPVKDRALQKGAT